MLAIGSFRPYLSQFLALISGSLAIISCGIDFGWPSPALPLLFSNSTPLDPPPDKSEISSVSSMLGTLYMGGGVVGLVFTFTSITILGRKLTLLVVAGVELICWILIATAKNLIQIYVARFLLGIAGNAIYVTLPMYNAECSQPQVRGLFGGMVYVMSMTGILLAYIITPFVPLWSSSLLPICLNTVMLSTFFFQPETPYYLLKKNKPEEAKKSLQHFRYHKDVSKELEEISAAVARQEAEKAKPLDLFMIPSNRKGALIMCLLNTAQNMAGVSVVIMNAQYLLEEASRLGGVLSPLPDELAAITFGAVMLAAGILGTILIDRFGRRFLLISSGALSAVFLTILAVYYAETQSFVDAGLTWIPLFSLIGYAFAFKCGLGLVPIVVNGEIFASNVKALGMVFSDFCFCVISTLSLQFYYLLAEPFGLYVPFVIFASSAGLATFLIYIYVPETKGRTLEEIQLALIAQTRKKTKTEI